jgi:hypothetical protein
MQPDEAIRLFFRLLRVTGVAHTGPEPGGAIIGKGSVCNVILDYPVGQLFWTAVPAGSTWSTPEGGPDQLRRRMSAGSPPPETILRPLSTMPMIS